MNLAQLLSKHEFQHQNSVISVTVVFQRLIKLLETIPLVKYGWFYSLDKMFKIRQLVFVLKGLSVNLYLQGIMDIY